MWCRRRSRAANLGCSIYIPHVFTLIVLLILGGRLSVWSEGSTTLTSDCSVTLGGVKVQVNGLDNKDLICPYKDEGDDADTKCLNSFPMGPHREPGAGEM